MTVRIINADVLDGLAQLNDESVHCVVTSPPYFGLRDYGIEGQIGLEPTPDAYVAKLVEVFREVRRVLRKDGTCWLNLGDSYAGGGGHSPNAPSSKHSKSGLYGIGLKEGGIKPSGTIKAKDLIGIPWRVAFALQADGWWLRQDIIWSKPNPMPESVTDRCTKAHEYIFLLTKAERYFYDAAAIAEASVDPESLRGLNPRNADKFARHDPDGFARTRKGFSKLEGKVYETRNRRSVWEIVTQPYAEAHFATFPPALIEPCIKAGCPKKACAKCGAPWVRQVARERSYDHVTTAAGKSKSGPYANQTGTAGTHDIRHGVYSTSITLGFSPSCNCNADTVLGTVLDPFGGSGTSGLVADRLKRNAVLIELNPEYAAMAERRVKGDCPMFAEVQS